MDNTPRKQLPGPDFDPYAEWLGIPPERRPPTWYDLLGLPAFESDTERIRDQAQERYAAVHRYQTSRHSEHAVRLLAEIAQARDGLCDPTRKASYDAELRASRTHAGNAAFTETVLDQPGAATSAAPPFLDLAVLPPQAPSAGAAPADNINRPLHPLESISLHSAASSGALKPPQPVASPYPLTSAASAVKKKGETPQWAILVGGGVLLLIVGIGVGSFISRGGSRLAGLSPGTLPAGGETNAAPGQSSREAAGSVAANPPASPTPAGAAPSAGGSRSAGAGEPGSSGNTVGAGNAESPPSAATPPGWPQEAYGRPPQPASGIDTPANAPQPAGTDPSAPADANARVPGLLPSGPGFLPSEPGSLPGAMPPAGRDEATVPENAASGPEEEPSEEQPERSEADGEDPSDSVDTATENAPALAQDAPQQSGTEGDVLQRALEADRLADEACDLLAARQAEAARKKLKEANRLAPDRVRAIFLLGLVEALEFRNPAEAQRAFRQALKRAPKHAAVLNNLAIVELRLDHVAQSINYFKAALVEAPSMSQAVNNLRRLAAYAKRGRVKLKKRDIELLEGFCDEQGGRSLDSRVGWLFVDLSAGGTESSGLRVAMNSSWQAWEDHACLGCDGLGIMDCPQRGCADGKVRVREAVGAAGFTPQGGSVDRRVPCDTCDGTGKVRCWWCDGHGTE